MSFILNKPADPETLPQEGSQRPLPRLFQHALIEAY